MDTTTHHWCAKDGSSGLVFKEPAEEDEDVEVDSYQIHDMVLILSL